MIIRKDKPQPWSQPEILKLSNETDLKRFEEISNSTDRIICLDEINRAAEELFHIAYPQQIDTVNEAEYKEFVEKLYSGNSDEYGSWVYYPWKRQLVHFPDRDHLRALRTSRNRNLITAPEQIQLFKGTVLVVGLSVGSNIIEAMLTQGIGGKYIIIDKDVIDPTNLNRIHANYDQLGVHKVDVVSKRISELDPYIEIAQYHDGLTPQNMAEIFDTHHPDIIVDEMDSLEMKILLRKEAQSRRLPVLMATDDGDDVLIDIERYDMTKELPLLHGRLPQTLVEEILAGKKLTRSEAGQIIGQYFVGLEYVPERMIASLLEVGKTLPSWPQLGGAATLAGICIAYAAKSILLELPLRSGRFMIGPDSQLNPEIETPEYKTRLELLHKKMMNPSHG